MSLTLDATLAPQDDLLLAYVGDIDGQYPEHYATALPPAPGEIVGLGAPGEDEIGLAPTGEFEPSLAAALRDAIADLLSADYQEGMEAAHTANLRLKRAGDLLGLTDGDGITADIPETNAPTPERVASRGTFEQVNVAVGAGRDAKADVWRHVPIVEAMVRRGQISKDYAASYTEAARRFYRDFVVGHSGVQSRVTAKYGELTGYGGTPLSQQVLKTYFDKHGVEHEVDGPEDRRAKANKAWWRACEAIGIVKCPVTGKPAPSETLHWMLVLVCEDYSVASEKTPSLEDAGRSYLGYKSSVQASAAGAALIKCGLERLVMHYGIEM